MKLAVISAEGDVPREHEVLAGLLSSGLEHFHVRKPGWDRARMEDWLVRVPADVRSRLVLHQHHELADAFGCGGVHFKDAATEADGGQRHVAGEGRYTSRACHDLAGLEHARGHYDAVFFSPVFPSISKPGHGPSEALAAISQRLRARTPAERRTHVFALGGITAGRVGACRALGFDGVAVLGCVWQAEDPVAAFCRLGRASAVADPGNAVMCITLDGLALSHVEQARQLCASGARWVQVRMKGVAESQRLDVAREVVAVCRAAGAICIVNDSVDVALAADAHGVHLGRLDENWDDARRRLGQERLLGGTVNNEADARRVAESRCLDYAGVGPWRFTATKQNLSPVLGPDGVARLIALLDETPAWVIGGIAPADLPAVHATGAAGVAVSSGLFRGGVVGENFDAYARAWERGRAQGRTFVST